MSITEKPNRRDYTKFGLGIGKVRCGSRINLDTRENFRKKSLKILILKFIRHTSRAVARNTGNLESRNTYSLVL